MRGRSLFESTDTERRYKSNWLPAGPIDSPPSRFIHIFSNARKLLTTNGNEKPEENRKKKINKKGLTHKPLPSQSPFWWCLHDQKYNSLTCKTVFKRVWLKHYAVYRIMRILFLFSNNSSTTSSSSSSFGVWFTLRVFSFRRARKNVQEKMHGGWEEQ